MPAGFHFPQLAEIWLAAADQPGNMNHSGHNYPVVARLRPGVSRETADAAMATVSRRLAQSFPDSNKEKTLIAMPLQEYLVGPTRRHALSAARRGRAAVSDCLRQRREPAAGAGDGPIARDGASRGARRRSVAHRPPTRRREPAARGDRRRRRPRARLSRHAVAGAAGADRSCRGSMRSPSIARCSPSRRSSRLSRALCSASCRRGRPRSVDLRERLVEGGAHGSIGATSNRLRNGLAVAEIALAVVLAVGGGAAVPQLRRTVDDRSRISDHAMSCS